jgi:hypothetical protein
MAERPTAGSNPGRDRPVTDTALATDTPMATDTPLRAELYLRGDASSALGVREVVTRAERLEANGTFGESLVAGRWHRIVTRAEEWRSEATATYEEFRAWAERNGLSLEPGFQERTRSFIGMDGVEEVVVFPVVALALYDAGDLAAVFPCTDGDRTYTVESALAAFERGDEDWLTQFEGVGFDRAEPHLGSGDATAD